MDYPPKTPKPENREIVSASLKLLAMRDMSRVQFVDKLTKKEFNAEDISEAVAWCEAEGWLNEARYAEVAARRLGHKYGASRVAATLRQKGVNDEAVASTINAMKDSEFSRAKAVWIRKFETLPDTADARAKQTRYLQSRGFSFAIIKRVLSGEVEEGRDSDGA
jgi:regulatory protein